jgi:hypothetical protein
MRQYFTNTEPNQDLKSVPNVRIDFSLSDIPEVQPEEPAVFPEIQIGQNV